MPDGLSPKFRIAPSKLRFEDVFWTEEALGCKEGGLRVFVMVLVY
jgi:hypothetical protein